MNAGPGKYFFQQRQRNRLYEAVVKAVEDAARLDGVRKKDIADEIGSNPSQISRWLSGPSNWTIDSISDVLWAIGGEFDFNFVRFIDRARQNRSHPANDINLASGASLVTPVANPANRMVTHNASVTTTSNAVVSVTRE